MKIEEAIKQPKFQDNFSKAIINILFTSALIKDSHTELFKKHGILHQHYNALRIIKGRYPNTISPSEIKEVMLEKANDLTRLLDKLVSMELIERNLCPSNRRKIDVKITKKGIDFLQKIQKPMELQFADLRKNITEKEAAQLSNLLDKLRG